MSEPKWTKGPWRATDGSFQVIAGAFPDEPDEKIQIADFWNGGLPEDENDANGQLMASAPSLYEALRACLAVLVECRDTCGSTPEELAAIALAEAALALVSDG